MPATWWDSHCHLNERLFIGRTDEAVDRALAFGVRRITVPAFDGPSLERTLSLALAHPGTVLPAFGLHPWFVDDDEALERAVAFASRPECAAIGEIGLDFSPGMPARERQETAFRRQLVLARELGKPALIHCRKAFPSLRGFIDEFAGGVTMVLHAFTAAWEMGRQLLDLGVLISIPPTVTRANARKIKVVAREIPWDRMLIETDAPSIALEGIPPAEVEPGHLPLVGEAIARIRGTAAADVAERSWRVAEEVFGG